MEFEKRNAKIKRGVRVRSESVHEWGRNGPVLTFHSIESIESSESIESIESSESS